MDKQDWYDMGAQIGDLVQSAIDSNDFKQLNQSITNTINDTVNLVQRNIQDEKRRAGNYQNGRRKTAYEQARERAYGTRESSRAKAEEGKMLPAKASKSYKGITYMAVGYSFMGIFGVMSAVFMSLSGVWGGFGIPAVVMLGLTGGFLGMGVHGSRLNARVKRQKQYLQIMGERDTCQLEELAAGTGKSKKYVTRDLKNMIQDQMFRGGAYLDTQETCLMTSQSAYRQYQDTMKQYEQRKAEEARLEAQSEYQKKEREKASASYSKEVQEILKDGRDFIAHIHECNDAIPDEVMSDKLYRLETVVTRIFDRVAKNPESAPDLHKMMSYYLPITRKLVDAYRDMDAQPVGGQNIRKTKKEIEDSLDTINTAFENLLDSFFQDTAWDIASDISVLHTMMAQDGLMKKDFAPGERIKTVARDVMDPDDKA